MGRIWWPRYQFIHKCTTNSQRVSRHWERVVNGRARFTTAEGLLRKSQGKAEDVSDVQIEWTEAEVYSNIDLDMSSA